MHQGVSQIEDLEEAVETVWIDVVDKVEPGATACGVRKEVVLGMRERAKYTFCTQRRPADSNLDEVADPGPTPTARAPRDRI